MEQSYISGTIKDFFYKLDNIHDQLETFSGKIDSKRDDVFKELNIFENTSKELKDNYYPRKDKLNAVEKELINTIDGIQNSVNQWHEEIKKNNKGIQFMHNHEKYLVVMIFGAVKAGKSTLGNFFAGKDFINANFDNEYKHKPHPEFATEEKGRDTGDIDKDSNGNTWFSEGVTDTTGDIQYFTLSGLRWMDSPGTGALEKETDKRNMEEMVNEYIPYTDLCIFLMNSSEPGLQADMKYIAKLSREEQEAIVVITKSDINDEDEDENGNMIDVWCAKSPETRKMQEEDILKRLHEMYPKINTNRFRAVSISTLLAKLAIDDDDEEKYKDSQLDKLMKILGDKASEDVISLKERKPKQNLNNFIDIIIEGGDNFKGINGLSEQLEKILQPINEYKQGIQDKTQKLQKTINMRVKNKISEESRIWKDEIERNNGRLEDSHISKRIMSVAYPILQEEINNEIGSIIDNYQETQIKPMQKVFNIGGLKKEYKTVTTEYTKTYYVPREADGLWEHVRSFFGKKYERMIREKHKLSKEVDLGTNMQAYLDTLNPLVESYVRDETKKALTDVQEHYFLPQEEYINKMENELEALKKQLLSLKFDMSR